MSHAKAVPQMKFFTRSCDAFCLNFKRVECVPQNKGDKNSPCMYTFGFILKEGATRKVAFSGLIAS